MKHVIKVPFTEVREPMENLALYEIVSKAIRKMLIGIMIKLQNEQQKPLTNEDKVLIYELSSMC